MGITEIRKRITEIDSKIIELIKERYELGKEIARLKQMENKSLWIPEVERAKLNSLPSDMNRVLLTEIFSLIIRMTREGEYEVLGIKDKIGVLGPEGSFSDEAGLRYAKSRLPLVHFPSFREIFDALEAGEISKAIVPFENSTTGTVMQVVRELLERELWITEEFEIPIELCLAGYGTKRIISHPQAIEQCSKFLSSTSAEIAYSPSTSKALEMIDEDSAAICSEYAAISRGIPILMKGIQDSPDNRTRFVVVEREKKDLVSNPVTIFVFWLEDRPGSLRDFLDILADRRINLRKLESRPWGREYMFIAEAEADLRGIDLPGRVRILGVCSRAKV